VDGEKRTVLTRVSRGRGGGATRLLVPAFAKVNLGLEVLGRREDDYHELRTLFQTIDLHDDIEIVAAAREVRVSCDHPLVPEDDENLAKRAADALRRHAGTAAGAMIRITKRIPVGGGLGGGSSDAAAVLQGLDRLWGLGLGPARLRPLAQRLGADVPFFLVGGTALGLARGDEVYPLERQVRAHVVLVDPGIPISTAAVFRRLDARLTPRENSNTIIHFVSRDLEADAWGVLSNELEQAALEEAPALAEQGRRIRGAMSREGARLTALSGSGSTYFGLFDDPHAARRAEKGLAKEGFTALRARTLSRDEYRRVWRRARNR
jgi:4-diphosphocytidyl-2-C-methyl-D-erythritol kinase